MDSTPLEIIAVLGRNRKPSSSVRQNRNRVVRRRAEEVTGTPIFRLSEDGTQRVTEGLVWISAFTAVARLAENGTPRLHENTLTFPRFSEGNE